MEAASIAHPPGGPPAEHEHHGPPPAHSSSRVDPQLLGMLLFIISEIMIFGAFFTAYFFIRVAQGDQWPAPGTHLPVYPTLVNTCILISSSFTMHWAQTSIKKGNRFGLKAGILTTFLLGVTFLFLQVNEIMASYFRQPYPARAAVGVSQLPKGARVEIECILCLD